MHDEYLHCKPRQVKPAYVECGNGAWAMQLSQVNLLELDPIKEGPVQVSSLDLLALLQRLSHIQCKLVQVYNAVVMNCCVSIEDGTL